MNCPNCHKPNPSHIPQCRHCGALLPRQSAKLLDSMTMHPATSLSLGIGLLFFATLLFFYDLPWFSILPFLCGAAFILIGLNLDRD